MTATITEPQPPLPASEPGAEDRQWLRILIIVQAAVATTAALEAAIFAALGGAPSPALLLTATGAALTWWLAGRLRRPSRRTFRALKWLQVGWLALAVIDLLLALFLARRGLGLTATLTRFVLPGWIYLLARRRQQATKESAGAIVA